LDKHMEAHHPLHHATETEEDGSTQTPLACPARRACESLGGMSACEETMGQLSPYYGPGTLAGREYAASSSGDSFLSSSVHTLMHQFYDHGSSDVDETEEDAPATQKRQHMFQTKQSPPKVKEAEVAKVLGEMRHRALHRNTAMTTSEIVPVPEREDGNALDNHRHRATTASSSSCDETEMERLFRSCRDMMQTCFGGFDNEHTIAAHDDSVTNGGNNHDNDNGVGRHTLADDLITQICEPLRCHHRLHRMAGHAHRHAVHWNDAWEEHHSFALGWGGWTAVVCVLVFYGCVYVVGGFGEEEDGFGKNGNHLPRHDRRKKKRI